MNGHRDFEDLISDSGPLVSISGIIVGENRFSILAFTFENGTLKIGCDGDTDEIVVQVVDAIPELPIVNHPLLTGLAEMTATYAWTLTNHRNYSDAFQLRLMAGDRTEQTRQFEVAASAIDVYRVVTSESQLDAFR